MYGTGGCDFGENILDMHLEKHLNCQNHLP